jgi:4-hydroxythreonine-4-phosphate dehydrogenase
LTRRFVHDALANLPPVDYFVATGGETARALCDALGIGQIDVLGQVEPGVSLARMSTPGGVLHLVLKSGSFGDPGTLVRVARMGGLLSKTSLERRL